MDLTALAATGLVALFLSAMLAADPVVMRSFSVPAEIEEAGYSDKLIGTLLRERIRYIARTADTARGETLSAYATNQTALETLAEQFNLDKVVDAFQEYFRLHRYSLSGYIAQTPDGLRFDLRADSAMGDRFVVEVTGHDEERIEVLINEMAERFVARADPYVLALYYFRLEYESASFDRAIPMLEHCVQVLPVELKKWPILVWGQALARTGDHEGAMVKYREALELDPGFGFALRSWGVSLWEHGQRDAALEKMRAAIAVPTVFPDLFDVLGNKLVEAGADTEARDIYVAGLTRFPDHPGLLLSLGQLYLRYEQYDPAVNLLEDALLAAPDNQTIQDQLNQAMIRRAATQHQAGSHHHTPPSAH